ncbi:hypothetical protein SLS61_004053 [Didymella pomorum]
MLLLHASEDDDEIEHGETMRKVFDGLRTIVPQYFPHSTDQEQTFICDRDILKGGVHQLDEVPSPLPPEVEDDTDSLFFYKERLIDYELARLRPFFLEKMQRLSPVWVAAFDANRLRYDIMLAATSCHDGNQCKWIKAWVMALSDGFNPSVSLIDALRRAEYRLKADWFQDWLKTLSWEDILIKSLSGKQLKGWLEETHQKQKWAKDYEIVRLRQCVTLANDKNEGRKAIGKKLNEDRDMIDQFVAEAKVHLRFQHEVIADGLLRIAQQITQGRKKCPKKAELNLAHDSMTYMAERTQFPKVDKLLEDISSKLAFTDYDAAHHIVNDFRSKNESSPVSISTKEVKRALMYRRSCIDDARNFLDYSLEEGMVHEKEYDEALEDLLGIVAAHCESMEEEVCARVSRKDS